MLAEVFENFRNMCLIRYELQNCKTSLGLAVLKKTKIKSDLLNDIDMLLMIEKVIREGICHSVYWYAKNNNKYMKDYDKTKNSPIFHTGI